MLRLPWRQLPPRRLRPNCLLTRYPVLFVSPSKETSWLNRIDPWSGIPAFLKRHGYLVQSVKVSDAAELASLIGRVSRTQCSGVHLIARDRAAMFGLKCCEVGGVKSLTFVNPLLFSNDSDLEFFSNLAIPQRVLLGSLEALGETDLWQRIAKSIGPVFWRFHGNPNQLLGRGPQPEQGPTAHEMFLQHCIFLAEYDLTTSQ